MRKTVLACDFCSKTQHELELLVAGPAVAICNQCIDEARKVVDGARAEKTNAGASSENRSDPASRPPDDAHAGAVHQAQVENGRWVDIDPQDIAGYRSCFSTVRTLYSAPPIFSVAPTVRTWRERIGVGTEFPLHAPTDVERAMVAEIAELRERLNEVKGSNDERT